MHRGASIMRNSAPLIPYSRNMPRALWRPHGGGLFFMSEVPLYLGRFELSERVAHVLEAILVDVVHLQRGKRKAHLESRGPLRNPSCWLGLPLKSLSQHVKRKGGCTPCVTCSPKRLTQGTVTSTMHRAAHPSGCARFGAGAGCSTIRYQSLCVTRANVEPKPKNSLFTEPEQA